MRTGPADTLRVDRGAKGHANERDALFSVGSVVTTGRDRVSSDPSDSPDTSPLGPVRAAPQPDALRGLLRCGAGLIGPAEPDGSAPRKSISRRGRAATGYAAGMADSDSLFERIVAREVPADIVRETERTIAIRDINPQAPTHVLVVPKVRYRNAAELAAADPGLLAELVEVAAAIAGEAGIAESGYRLLFNTNADAGQTIFHVHLHLLGGRPLGGLAGQPEHG